MNIQFIILFTKIHFVYFLFLSDILLFGIVSGTLIFMYSMTWHNRLRDRISTSGDNSYSHGLFSQTSGNREYIWDILTNTDRLNFPQRDATNVTSRSHGDKKLLCHDFTGRLGNLLFQYASVLGLSLTMDRIPVFKTYQDLDSLLKYQMGHPSRQAEMEARCDTATIVAETTCCMFDQNMVNLDPSIDYRTDWYLQSWKYFHQHEDRIKIAITFAEPILHSAREILKDFRRKFNGSTLIGVHVRRGDLLTEENKNLGYPTATPEYFQRSLSYFRNLFPNSVFFIASDDVGWCKDNFPAQFNVSYLTDNSPAVHLALLSTFDHIVITFGTFSWWAGYLNPGITVYMKDFIIPNTFIGNQFHPNGSDYIFPTWVPL